MGTSLYDYCIKREKFLVLSQWDKTKNGDLTPHTVSYGSHTKIWWQCERGHQWQAAIYTRTTGGSGCPYCKGKKLDPDAGTLARLYPELAKQWHPTKNVDVTAEAVSPGTHRKVWWICENGHEWQAQINSRTGGSGCPVCTNRKVKLGENDLATTHPDLAAQWDKEKNGVLKPETVMAGSRKSVWWTCSKGHSWKSQVFSRTAAGSGCPVCNGKRVVVGENDLKTLFPQVAAQWHPENNGTMMPCDVTAFSNRKVWWQCKNGHAYTTSVSHKTSASSECPFCTNRMVLKGFNDLETKHPKVAAQWHPSLNGELTPQMVTSGSRKKVWWQCFDGHVWKAVIYSRTSARQAGCPVCAGKVKTRRVEVEL